MLSITDLKIGTVFSIRHNPDTAYLVLSSKHSKQARGGAVLKTKIKNITTGAVTNATFKSADKFMEVEQEKERAEFLYQQDNTFHFMLNSNYEQIEINKGLIAEQIIYLKEQLNVDILKLNNQIIGLQLPIKIAYCVVSSPPVIKRATADSGQTKKIRLETGLEIDAPMFIKKGDKVVVDTRTGQYVERS